jgi:hypothetical protein
MKRGSPVARRRPKFTATADPDLLDYVDRYVSRHQGLDRSAVVDEALRLWKASVVEREMEEQFARPDGVDPAERQAWNAIQHAAVARHLSEGER